jgi:hypothetical protein
MLSETIPPPDRKQFLTVKKQEDWRNPFLRLNSDGTVTLLASSNAFQKLEGVNLEKALVELPVSDWPFGRVIAVQPCATRSEDKAQYALEDKALKETWSRMRDTMSKLNVQVNLWPSA